MHMTSLVPELKLLDLKLATYCLLMDPNGGVANLTDKLVTLCGTIDANSAVRALATLALRLAGGSFENATTIAIDALCDSAVASNLSPASSKKRAVCVMQGPGTYYKMGPGPGFISGC